MKKILSVVIAISMLLGMMIPMGITASAAAATECATWAEVVAAVEADSAASIKLTNHVTADSTIASFAGTFDGNGYTVTVETTMFAEVTGTATLKNFQTAAAAAITVSPIVNLIKGEATVTIENVVNNVDVDATVQLGGFASKTSGTVTLKMVSCVNNGDLASTNQVSGIVGNADGTLTIDFTDVVNNGDITGTKNYAGGIISANGKLYGTMNRSINNGKVTVSGADASNAAGFIGTASGVTTVTLTDCVNAGAITVDSTKGAAAKYGAGAFLSRAKKAESVITLDGCISAGAISASEGHTADAIAVLDAGSIALGTAGASIAPAAGATTVSLASGAFTTVDAAAAEAAIAAIEAEMTLPTFDADKAPEGGDTPDTPERFSFSVDAGFGTATVEGPKYMTVGTTDAITVTFSSTEGMTAMAAGFNSENTNVVDFPGEVTFESELAFTDSTDETYAKRGCAGFSTSGDPVNSAVITIPVSAIAVGTSAITLIVDGTYDLFFCDPLGEEEYTHNVADIGYTITVVDENADEPIVVDLINVNGYVEPTVGASLADSLAGLSVPEGANYSIVKANWYNDDTFENATEETFAAGTTYCLYVELKINDNCTFADDVVYQINGGTELVNPNYTSITAFGISYFSVSTTLNGTGSDEPTGNVVTNVNVNGYVAPTVGANLADALANLSVPAGAPYSIVDAYWFDDATFEIATEETFAAGGMYCLYVRFALADGYTLDIENCVYALNGDETLVLFGSPNYDETVDCDFLICSITTTLDGGEGGEEGGDEPTTPDGTEEHPFVIQNKDDVAAILVPAGETYYFIIDPFTYYDTVGEDFIGNLIKVIGEGATINGNATLDLPTNGRMGWPVLFSITAGTEDARAEIVVPKGTFSNPDSFDADGKAEVSLTSPKNDFEPYMFIFKADKNGILVVTAPDGTVVTINNLTSYSYGDMGINTAEVVAGDEIQILIGTEGADAAGTVSVTIVPHLNIAVWTKNGDWVTADELAAMKADFIAYLENEFDIDTSVLGIEWVELTTDGNKVADLGALVNAGNFDIIVGCGNNVDSTAGVTIVKKDDINTDYVAAGRKVALLDENNALAAYLYDLLTELPAVEIDKVDVSGYVDPVHGQTVGDYMASFIPTLPEGANYSIHGIYFFELDPETMEMIGELLADDYVFDSSKTYAVSIIFEANDGYVFASNAVITVNGGDVELLETAAEGNRAGAAIAFAPAASVEIDKIDVSGITAPEHGKTLADYKASFVPVLPEGANYSVAEIFWFELDPETMTGDEITAEDYVFDSTKTYGFALYVTANDGYTFADGAVITANGGALELYESMVEGSEAGLALIFNPAPDTGDNSAIAIFAIAAVATIGCVALALRKKKED